MARVSHFSMWVMSLAIASALLMPAAGFAQTSEPDSESVTPTLPVVDGQLGHGVTFRPGSGFSINLRSRMMLRTLLARRNSAPDPEWTQTTNVRVVRLWLSGHAVDPRLTWMTQLAFGEQDFRDGAQSPIYDAFVQYAAHRDLTIRGGQFFVPFDRLRTIGQWTLQTGERPSPIQELALSRDIGLVASSDSFLGDRSPFAWRLGVFSGGGIHRTDTRRAGAMLVGRLELRPAGEIDDEIDGDLTRRARPAIALGAAGAWNINADRQRSTTGRTFESGTIDYVHFAADLVFKWRGLALQTELITRQASRDLVGTLEHEGVTSPEFSRSGTGWIVQLSWLLSFPLEWVARAASTNAHGGTDPDFVQEVRLRGREYLAGANWYFNGHRMKLQTGWIGRTSPEPGQPRVMDHSIYLQFDMSF